MKGAVQGVATTVAKIPLRKELQALRARYAEQIEKREMIVRERVAARLKEMGITGNAVEPNLEEWDEWGESVRDAGQAFKKGIAEWKEKLKAEINR